MTRNMKIGKRLALFFITVSIIGSASGVFGAFVLEFSNKQYTDALKKYSFVLGDLNNLAFQMNSSRVYLMDIVYLNELNEKLVAEQKLYEMRKSVDSIIESLTPYITDITAKKLWYDFGTTLGLYTAHREKVVELALENTEVSNAEAYSVWINSCAPELNTCIKLLDTIVQLNISQGRVVSRRLDVQSKKALIFMIFAVCITFFISIIFALRLSRNINIPLKKITEAASRIAAYDTDFELDINTKDEIGLVAEVLNTSVKNAFAEIKRQNSTINESLSYASKIQRNILPQNTLFEKFFSDYSTLWKPREEVGGDIYQLYPFDDGVLLVVCDCTGHGIPGALMTMIVSSTLSTVVNSLTYKNPQQVIWELDSKLIKILNVKSQTDASEISDGLDLVAAYISKDGRITFSSANMHLFVCNGSEVETLRGQRIQIGNMSIESCDQIRVNTIEANKNNRYFIASDGLFDQIGGSKRLPFGYKRFNKVILECNNLTLDLTTNVLWKVFYNYKKDEQQRDDITLVSFKV